MPYLVSTKRPHKGGRLSPTYTVMGEFVVSRVAVATLEEARDHISRALDGLPTPVGLSAADVMASFAGGTVGPLPDGSLIEVEPITWFWLAREAGHAWRYVGAESSSSVPTEAVQVAILAAFNEANR